LRRRLALLGGTFALLLLGSFAAALSWGIQREVESSLVAEVQLLARSGVAQWSMVEHERREALHLPPEPTSPIVDLHEQTDDQLVQWFTGDLVLMDELGNGKLAQRRRPPSGPNAAPDRWDGGIALWKPVVSESNRWNPQPKVLGWVYVAISDADAEAEQLRLLRGVGLGAIAALVVALLVGQRLILSTFVPLQRQVEALERFTGDASHELRHPLTTLRTLVATQRGQAVSPEVLERIDTLAARLGRLLDDLLYLSRVDQGIGEGKVLRQHWESIDLGELLEDVIGDCQLQADRARCS
jgi:signal transduction histidine kinase